MGSPPLSDRLAAARVDRSAWEPRPGNRAENRRIPTRSELRFFRRHSDMTYKRRVSGRFRGTTDEIIQWAAHKHGIAEDVVRAVAVKESWWRMSTVGDDGDSFGLMQVRRPYHCCPFLARARPPSTPTTGGHHPLVLRRARAVAEHRGAGRGLPRR